MTRTAWILGILVALAVPGSAQEATYGPDIPAARGETCVADPDFMRVNHMSLLRHDRDDTVRDGNRDVQFSLSGCIDCHAVEGSDGTPVSIKSEEHFCRVCHDYVAVKVDCFQCHNSKPEGDGHASSGLTAIGRDFALLAVDHSDGSNAISIYLEEVKQ